MGRAIRTNLFQHEPGREFARFAVQVLLLFRPNDEGFANHLQRHFMDLHKLTDRDVVFFAPLDPPKSWLSDRANRRWWDAYKQEFGEVGFSFDDSLLLYELSRLFGVELAELPVCIASPNLWTGDLVVSPTSSDVLSEQLAALTRLAGHDDAPSIEAIQCELQAIGGFANRVRLSEVRKKQIGEFYGALSAIGSDKQFKATRLDNQIRRVVSEVDSSLADARKVQRQLVPMGDDEDADRRSDALLDDATGRLIPFAIVAERIHGAPPIRNHLALDDESSMMLETAHQVGWFLEQLVAQGAKVDFTPGAQGAWKAFEREVNLSAIQAARGSLGIEMPEYFTLFKPSFPCVVQTGQNRSVDLNKKDKLIAGKRHHAFITLGNAYFVIKSLLEEPEKRLSSFLETQPDAELIEPSLLDSWHRIYKIRNSGSHVEPLDWDKYREVLRLVEQPAVMQPLQRIKAKIVGGTNPVDMPVG